MRRVLQAAVLLFAIGTLGVLSCSAQRSVQRSQSQQAPQRVEVRSAGYAPLPAPVNTVDNEFALSASKAGPVMFRNPPAQPPQQQAQQAPAR